MCRRVPSVVRVPSPFRNNFLMDAEIETTKAGIHSKKTKYFTASPPGLLIAGDVFSLLFTCEFRSVRRHRT
jgi:hypothetical protein